MNTLSYKTQSAKKETIQRDWFVVNAAGKTCGRLATAIAHRLRGKHKPSYTPHVDTGDYIIVLNADKIRFTGLKEDQKQYIWHTGYPGGQKRATVKEVRAKQPQRIIESAVRGMLPKNRLGRAMFKKMFVYNGNEHPHTAQKPRELDI